MAEGQSEQPDAERVGRRRRRLAGTLPWVVERTLLAWVRTGIAIMAFGALLVRWGLRRPEWVHSDRLIGVALVLGGGVVSALGAIRYLAVRRALERDEAPVADPRLPVALAIAVAIAAMILVLIFFPSLG